MADRLERFGGGFRSRFLEMTTVARAEDAGHQTEPYGKAG
jgi:hypothetical protein